MNKKIKTAIETGRFQVDVGGSKIFKQAFVDLCKEIFGTENVDSPARGVMSEDAQVFTFTVNTKNTDKFALFGWNSEIREESEYIGLTMDETVEVLNSFRKPKFKVVKLNGNYNAEVSKTSVKVGCQTFSIEVVKEILKAAESL